MARRSQGRFVDHSTRRKPMSRLADVEDIESPVRHLHRSGIHRYFSRHFWVASDSLGQLLRTPFATLMTAAVIAIALALPAGLYLLLTNVQAITSGWQDTAQISVFLKPGTKESTALRLQQQIKTWKNVTDVQYISPDQALTEFKTQSGFGDVLSSLNDNPLPPVLILYPRVGFDKPQILEQLARQAREQTLVDHVQLDMEWVRRLAAIIDLGQRGILLLGAVLGIAILLIIGNTIRLTIFNRRQEIVVTKLIGATNTFIRQPFLYTGIWYGLLGAVLAWALLTLLTQLLSGPVQALAQLYQSQFTLGGLGVWQSALLIFTGVSLGFIGSWLAASRHLQAIEPV